MKTALFLATVLAGFCCAVGDAGAQQSRSRASSDWNGNYDFPDASNALVKLNRARLIEDQKNYKPPVTNVTNYAVNSTNVESMIEVSGDGSTVNTNNSSTGNTSNSTTNVTVNGVPITNP